MSQINEDLGKFVTATVAVPGAKDQPVRVRQGILVGATDAGNPVLLGETNTTYQGAEPGYTVVPDSSLNGDTVSFVERWRQENTKKLGRKPFLIGD